MTWLPMWMAGLDRLLAKSLDSIIRKHLGDKTIRKIEDRLFEKYGISLAQSIEQFQKLDVVLREIFGTGADGLEQRFIKAICHIKTINNEKLITLEDQPLTKIILESFGDNDKKRILNALNDNSLIISQILVTCNMPQTSGYRKINSLIDDGLLAPSGFVTTPEGKRVSKYRSVFNNVKIDILKNKVTATLRLTSDDYVASSILSICEHV